MLFHAYWRNLFTAQTFNTYEGLSIVRVELNPQEQHNAMQQRADFCSCLANIMHVVLKQFSLWLDSMKYISAFHFSCKFCSNFSFLFASTIFHRFSIMEKIRFIFKQSVFIFLLAREEFWICCFSISIAINRWEIINCSRMLRKILSQGDFQSCLHCRLQRTWIFVKTCKFD